MLLVFLVSVYLFNFVRLLDLLLLFNLAFFFFLFVFIYTHLYATLRTAVNDLVEGFDVRPSSHVNVLERVTRRIGDDHVGRVDGGPTRSTLIASRGLGISGAYVRIVFITVHVI